MSSKLLQDLGPALRATDLRANKWRAWQHLLITDQYGIESVLPYTPEAIAYLKEAHAWDENDGDSLHHLAIACHALAWDLELTGEWDRATEAWKEALFYWQRLQACSSFWQAMLSKGRSLRAFDPRAMENARRDMIENLLEVHVEFVRHYYQQHQPQQAARHVELIRQARLAPAARKRMDDLVYDAMTTSIPSLLAGEQYRPVLDILDECLHLLAAYPPALIKYLETATEWISQISPSDSGPELLELDRRVVPRWNALSSSQELVKYPLAHAALADLASALGRNFWARADYLRLNRRDAPPSHLMLDSEEYTAYERAVYWLEQCRLLDASQRQLDYDLFHALIYRADFAVQVADATAISDEATKLLDAALLYCQSAKEIGLGTSTPDEMILLIEGRRQGLRS